MLKWDESERVVGKISNPLTVVGIIKGIMSAMRKDGMGARAIDFCKFTLEIKKDQFNKSDGYIFN